MGDVTVRPLARGDEATWRRLWTGYLDFYETSVGEAVYADTFERLLDDDPWQPGGLVATVDDRVVGIVHYLFHSHCWHPERACYLQDLFTDPGARGRGVAPALIEAVAEIASGEGASVYWMTHEGNATARRLYDRLASYTGSVIYRMEAA